MKNLSAVTLFVWIFAAAVVTASPQSQPTANSTPTPVTIADSEMKSSLTTTLENIAAVIAIIGATVGVTRHIDTLQAKVERGKLVHEIDRLKEQTADLDAKYKTAMNAGTVALKLKDELDAELSTIAAAVGARSTSVLVPAPSRITGSQISELVFLTLKGPGSDALKRARIPLSSLAGKVFLDRKTVVTHKAEEESVSARQAEQTAKISAAEMLAVPLAVGDRCCGVAEFLNKEQGQFDSNDQNLVQRLVGSLALKVANFTADPENLKCLGITPKEDAQEATVMFCDLTRSSQLFRELDAASAIDLINEYFEAICDVALRAGATIDNFLGDGVLIVLNARRPVAQHSVAAVTMAMQMQDQFAALKKKWTTFHLPVDSLFNRIGISSGRVHAAEVGHPQYRRLTVMGDVVNRAAALCADANRERNVVVVDDTIQRSLPPHIAAAPSKTNGDTRTKAFELTPLPVGAAAMA